MDSLRAMATRAERSEGMTTGGAPDQVGIGEKCHHVMTCSLESLESSPAAKP